MNFSYDRRSSIEPNVEQLSEITTMNDGIMQERGRGLEEAFFARENERLRQLLSTGEKPASKETMTENSGLTNDIVLDNLGRLSVPPAIATAMALVPLIGVAWSDGTIQDAERIAILKAAQQIGINKNTPAYQVLDHWLVERPELEIYDMWKVYVESLCSEMDENAAAGLRDEVMTNARSVAKAAGGVMGIGTISASERRVLEGLEEAFSR